MGRGRGIPPYYWLLYLHKNGGGMFPAPPKSANLLHMVTYSWKFKLLNTFPYSVKITLLCIQDSKFTLFYLLISDTAGAIFRARYMCIAHLIDTLGSSTRTVNVTVFFSSTSDRFDNKPNQHHRTVINLFLNGTNNGDVDDTYKRSLRYI